MSIKLGTQDIAGISQNTKYNAHHLLDFKWTDCIMNDVSWLRADTFSWQSGAVYVSAYNHLVQDLQGTTAETETIGSYTVTFYRATDGHKICLADQEQTVLSIYNTYGVAWYYILDTTNTQFKLPRTKYGFEGLRGNVGDKIDESLPNITGDFNPMAEGTTTVNGSFYVIDSTQSGWGTSTGLDYDNCLVGFNASRSSSTYQDNAPVQERATQMYLYFYVGDYTQSAIEQTAGLNAELFNGKVDRDLSNLSTTGQDILDNKANISLSNVNNSAKVMMASMGMPSNTYINLTLGASGTTYTAPANGWVYVNMHHTVNAYSWIDMTNITSNFIIRCGLRDYCGGIMPVSKGDSFFIGYDSNSLDSSTFRFIYAQGSESEAS